MSTSAPQLLDEDERLFTNGLIWRYGEWIAVREWFAHSALALPGEWLDEAIEHRNPAGFREGLDRYLAAAESHEREAVRFNPPRLYEKLWMYQSVKGRAPLSISADVRELFERLTPGSRWWLCPVRALYLGSPVDGHMFARVHPLHGVRAGVAACDPRLPR